MLSTLPRGSDLTFIVFLSVFKGGSRRHRCAADNLALPMKNGGLAAENLMLPPTVGKRIAIVAASYALTYALRAYYY
jgi:hypothetical protein